MSTATITANGKAGGNGAAKAVKPAESAKPEIPAPSAFDYARLRELTGMVYLRGYECMQLLNVVRAAFSEGDRCVNRAERATTEGEVRDALVDALTCVATGEHYARMLLDQLIPAERDGGDVPLF